MSRFKKYKQQLKPGFTLIEIMLVVALMVAIGGISVPVYQSFQVKNNLDVAAYTIVQTLRRAQVLSQSGAQDSSWGVKIVAGQAILFKGANFTGRDIAWDEISEISANLSLGGADEIVYSKLVGEPQMSGNIVLTTSNNETKNITINSKGTIEY